MSISRRLPGGEGDLGSGCNYSTEEGARDAAAAGVWEIRERIIS